MKDNTHLPVSIKIRVEGGGSDFFHRELVNVIKDAGVDYLIVHGRHWTEHYETPCHYDDIRYFVNELTIPVIGNGDIACIDSLKKMFATGCAGVMLGRAGVGQPWLIKKLIALAKNELFIEPSHSEIGSLFIEHVKGLIELLGNEKFAILQARKFAKYYARTLNHRFAFSEEINDCDQLTALEAITHCYFQSL